MSRMLGKEFDIVFVAIHKSDPNKHLVMTLLEMKPTEISSKIGVACEQIEARQKIGQGEAFCLMSKKPENNN